MKLDTFEYNQLKGQLQNLVLMVECKIMGTNQAVDKILKYLKYLGLEESNE